MINDKDKFINLGEIPEQKVIFCDIDGTLLTPEKIIHDKAKKAIKELINNNLDYHFALASGRNLADELMIYRDLELKNTGFLIGSNGAQIYSLKSHKIIFERQLDPKIVIDIYSKFLEILKTDPDVKLMISYNNSSVFLNNVLDFQWEQYHLANIKVRNNFDPNNVIMISIFFLKERMQEFADFLKLYSLDVIEGKKLLTINAFNVSKASAINFLRDKFKLLNTNIAVIGDSKNDLSMFQLPLVYGITHSNAKPYIKKAAVKVINLPESEFISEGLIYFKKYIEDKK